MKGVTNYIKNVTKSVAFSAVDVAKADMAPDVIEFATTNKDAFVSTYALLKNPKTAVKKSVQAIQQSKVYQAIDYGTKNLFEDLRTGNFYNRERIARDEASLAGLDADDWSDLSEFGVDDDWQDKVNKPGSSSSASEVTAGDRMVIASIEGSNAAMAKATVNAIVGSADSINKGNRANMAMLYTQNEKLFSGLHQDIGILGNTMNAIYKMQSATFQNIDKNMSSYFTEALKLDNERNAIMKEMLEMQRNMYKSAAEKEKEQANSKRSNKKFRWNDISSSGMPDLDNYISAVKKNINNEISGMGIPAFSEDSNMLASFMVSPLKYVTDYVVSGLIPTTIKEATKELNDSITGIFGNIIGALGNARANGDGGIMGTLAKIFGVNTGVNRTIDASKYEKGPVPFDGITRKAIIDVIPSHLRRIEAALTGRPEQIFDYNSGKWVKARDIKKQYDDIRKNAINSATSELKSQMNPSIRKVAATNKYDRESLGKAFDELYEFLYENNGRFNPNASVSKNKINSAKYPNLTNDKIYKVVCEVFKNFATTNTESGGSRTNYSKLMKISNNVLSAKDNEERQYRDIENATSSAIKQFFAEGGVNGFDQHGKWKDGKKFQAFNNLNDYKDEFGNSVFNYLQNINKELTWLRLNGAAVGGSGRRGRNRSSATTRTTVDFNSINLRNPRYTEPNRAYNNPTEQRDLDSALAKISNGDAVDFRDFEVNEQEALLHLAAIIRDGNTDELNKKLRGNIDSNAVSAFMDKHFIRTNTTTLRDVQNRSRKADEEGKNTDEVDYGDVKEKNFVQKIKEVIGQYGSVGGAITGAGVEAFRNVLYTADKAIYEMMYKAELKSEEGGKKYEGFMDMLVGKTEEAFKGMKNYIEENILKPFKDRLGIGDDFTDRFKTSFKNIATGAGKMFIDANKDVYKPLYQQTIGAGVDKYKSRQKINATRQRIKDKGYTRDEDGSIIVDAAKAKRDVLATQKMRRSREGALARGDQAVISLLRSNKDKSGFYSDDENEMIDKLIDLGVSASRIDKIREYSKDADGNYDHNKFIGSLGKIYLRYQEAHHAKGTMGRPFEGKSMLSKGELLFNSKGMSLVNKTDAYDINEPTHILNTEDSHDLLAGMGVKNLGPKTSIQQALGKEKLAKNRLFGKDNIAHNASGNIKIDGQDISPKELIETGKKYLPEITAGGAFGGIIGLLLGGPILGAGIGAAASLVKNSDTLKDKLFGKAGQDGKRAGGIISKATQDTVKKYLPDMAKYGLAGIIPGLLTPLGPIGGLLIGGTIGMLKNNEKFTNKYFGENGKLTIGSKEKEIIQKMFPAAAKGAGIGAIAGLFVPSPFGFLGNAVIGSAIGMMTTTDEWKEMILGSDINGVREGGLVGVLKDALKPITGALENLKDKVANAVDKNIVDPLQRFMTPAIHALPKLLGKIPAKISDKLEEAYDTSVGQKIKTALKPVSWLGSKAINGAGKAFNAVTSPVRLLGKAGDKIKENAIINHEADYMTAEERVNFLNDQKKSYLVTDFDRGLANIGKKNGISVEQAKNTLNNLNVLRDSEAGIESAQKRSFKDISKNLEAFKMGNDKSLSNKTLKNINKALENNNTDQVIKLLENSGMSKEEFNSLMDGDVGLRAKLTNFSDLRERKRRLLETDKTEATNKAQELLNELGVKDIDLKNRRDVEKIAKLLNTEIVNREANPNTVEGKELLLSEERNNVLKQLFESVNEVKEIMKENAGVSGDKAAQNFKSNVESKVSEAADKANEKYDAVSDKESAKFEGEVSDKVKDEMSRHSSNPVTNMVNSARHTRQSKSLTGEQASEGIDNLARSKQVADIGVKLDEGVLEQLNSFKKERFNRVVDILNQIKRYVNNANMTITTEDIEFLDSLSYREAADFVTHCKGFDKAKKYGFERLKQVFEADYSNYGFTSTKNNIISKVKGAGKFTGGLVHNVVSSVNPLSKNFVGKRASNHANDNRLDSIYSDDIEQHGIGSFLLKGASAIGKGIKSLFGGNKDENGDGSNKGVAGKMAGLLSMMGAKKSGEDSGYSSIGDTNETDKEGDGRDIVQTSEGPAFIERGTDGSIDYDTTDAKTKEIVNKLSLKEKLNDKFVNAQLKASESINKLFGEAEGEKKTTKLSLLSLLFGGALLAKSGILGKMYDNIIKPLWEDKLKPWIKDKALPWIQNVAIPAIGNALSSAIDRLISDLPELIKKALGIGGTVADTLTRNVTNVGGSTTVDAKGKTGETGMYDENGKTLTYEDIAAGNYKKIYNKDGVEGIVNDDGTVTFEDQSVKGSSYAKVVGNGAVHAFAQGSSGLLVKGLDKISNSALKHSSAALKSASKVGKVFSGAKKVFGATSKLITAPVTAAGKAGSAATNKLAQGAFTRTENAALRAAGNVVDDSPGLLKRAATKISTKIDGTKVGQWLNSGRDLNRLASNGVASGFAENAGVSQKIASKAATVVDKAAGGAKKATGYLGTLLTKAKEAIGKLLGESAVVKKIQAVCKTLGIDDVAKWIGNLKDKLVSIFDDALTKGCKEAGEETVKQAASKVNLVLTIALVVKDFLWGCDQAESILGVTNTNVLEELGAGLINALCNLLILPAIIPGVNWIAQKLFTFFGDDLKEKQEEAEQELEEYNQKNGTTLTTEEYLKQEYSVTGKIGSKVKGFFSGIGKGVKSAGSTVVNGVKNAGSWVADKASSIKDTVVDKVKGAASAVGTVTEKVGGFVKSNAVKTIDFAKELGSKVTSGDIKGLISYKAAGDEEGVLATIQNMAGNVAKVPLMVPTIISAGIHKVADLVTSIVDKVKDAGSKFLDLGKQIGGYVKSGDVIGLMGFNSGVEGTEDYSGELSKSTVGGVKLLAFIPTVLSLAVNKVSDIVGNIVDGVKTAGKAIGNTVWTMKDFVIKGDISGLISYESPEGDDFGSKVSKVTSHVSKVAMFVPTAVSAGIHKVAEIVTTIINGVKTAGAAIGNTVWTMKDFVIKGDLNGLISYKSPEGDDFATKVSSVTANVSKVAMFVPTAVSAGIHKVADIISNVIDSVKIAGESAVNTVWTMKDYVISGDLTGLHIYQPTETEGLAGGVAKVVSGIGKVVMTPPTLVSLGIHKIADGITAIIETGKTVASGIATVGGDLKDFVLSGDTEGLADYSPVDGDDFLSKAGGVVTNIAKVIVTPATYISKGIHTIGDKFSEIVTEITTIKDETDSIIEKAKSGEVSLFSSDYWSTSSESTGFVGAIGKVYGYITKIINAPMVLMSNIFTKVADAFNNVKDWLGEKFSGVAEFFDDPLAFIYKKITGKDTGEGTGGSFVSSEDEENENGTGTFGRGRYGRGYSKQIDPSIKNYAFNKKADKEKQTIGDSGCGPAAAVNVLEAFRNGRGSYGRGGSAVINAANYALRNGYKETDGGTKPGFFSSYFKKSGYGSQTTSSRSQLEQNINNGMPTVLMGKDARGTSSSTPFGKTPHYITVTGTDGKGHAIVQDPESKRDNQLYSTKELLSKSSLGVSAFGRGRYGRGRYGRGVPDNTTSQQVWAFFTNNGISPAATAGILGNMYAESGVNPAVIQGNGKGPAAGIVQWENYNSKSARWKAMADYAASRGKDWTDLDSQLNYVMKEMKDPGCTYWNKGETAFNAAGANFTTFDEWSKSSDVPMATKQFEAAFERAGVPAIEKRVNAAAEYYKLYQDKNYTYDGSVDSSVASTTAGYSSSDSTGTTSDSTSSGTDGILSIFSNVLSNSKIGKALAAFTGGLTSSSSSSADASSSYGTSSSSEGDSSYSGTTGGTYSGTAGGDPKKILEAAASQIGVKETGDNNTPYGAWYPMNGQPWCAMFVSWCANKAGIPTNVIPKYSYCPNGYDELLKCGGKKVTGAEGKPGDIAFFHNGTRFSHTGIVEDVSNGEIHTIEGNTSDMVARRSYATNASKVYLLRPNYADTTSDSNSSSTTTTQYAAVGHDDSYENTRGGNDNKPLAKYGIFNENIHSGTGGYGTTGRRVMLDSADGYFKTEEPLEAPAISHMQKSITRKNTYYGKGTTDSTNSNNLLNSIVNILMTIADNTDKLNLIVSILNEKLGINVTAEDVANNTGNSQTLKSQLQSGLGTGGDSKFTSYSDAIGDGSLNSIISAMNSIAAE